MQESLNMVTAVLAETMNETVHGLIIKEMDFKDYDAILTVLTKEYGKISFRAAGVRKMGSKNAGAVLPYTMAEFQFDYKEQKTMFRMKTARTINLYRQVHEQLNASYAAAVAAEAADAFSLPGEESDTKEELFDEVRLCFDMLNEGHHSTLVLCLYLCDLMKMFGIQPEVDGCVKCGKKRVNALSAIDGGFLCAQHAREENIAFNSPQQMKRFRLIVKAGLKNIAVVEEAGGAEKQDLWVLERMIKLHGSMELKSFRLYNRLFGIE